MKKKMAALLAVSMLLCGQALAADFSNLVIIHTNDTHGFDRRAEGINGMATVSALRKHYLSREPKETRKPKPAFSFPSPFRNNKNSSS